MAKMQIKLPKNLILSVFKPFYMCPSFATTLYNMIKIWRIKKCGNSLSGWLEWGKNIVNVKSLNKTSYLPASVVEFLVWFHFGSSGKS